MANSNSSQAQNKSTGSDTFDPMAAFTKLTEDHIERMTALYDELAAWEAKTYDRAKANAEQFASMAQESMAYVGKLTAEWRELTLEATRKGAEMFSNLRNDKAA